MAQVIAVCLLLILYTLNSVSSTGIAEGVNKCHKSCAKTYPLHTYPNTDSLIACQRGCRFAAITQVMKFNSSDENSEACFSVCSEAYSSKLDVACQNGCDMVHYYLPSVNDIDFMPQYSYPFIYIQNIYVNAVNQAVHYFRIQWGFLITSSSNELIAVQSGPEVMIAIEEIGDSTDEKQISERHSRPVERNNRFTGWLECISYHTGLPVWLVCATLLTSFVALIGLCCIWVYDSDDETDKKKNETKYRTITKQPMIWPTNKSIPVDISECKQPLLINSSVVKVPPYSNL